MSSDSRLIRVLTADDHALLREGIGVLVNGEPDMKLVAEASTSQVCCASRAVPLRCAKDAERRRIGRRKLFG